MSRLRSFNDRCLILIKALPHLSSKYSETVCCAGLGEDGKWRRQYPIPFRILQEPQKFHRWNWISYKYTEPRHDGRAESQKVVPESIEIENKLPDGQKSKCLYPAERESFSEAESRKESLTIIRPSAVELSWVRRSQKEIDNLRNAHSALSRQLSMFDAEAPILEPCPYTFKLHWESPDGMKHNHICDDWETSAAFFRRRRSLQSDEGALDSLKQTYEIDFFRKGMVLGFSTHSRRHDQWLLVGIIRVDQETQPQLQL